MPTVDPADIRGLVTTLLFTVKRLPHSRHEGRPKPPLNALEGCAKPGPRPLLDLWNQTSGQLLIGTSLAMAHMKAMSSRATAVAAMFECLPRAVSRRNRLHRRS